MPSRRKKDPGELDLMERDVTRGFNGRTLWMRRPRTEKVNEFQVWSAGARRRPSTGSGVSSYFSPSASSPSPIPISHPGTRSSRPRRCSGSPTGLLSVHTITAVEKTEVIDGSTCLVLRGSLNDWFKSLVSLSPPMGDIGDRIWLDRDHGWAVRRREQSKDGLLLVRWENSGFREVEPGLWLPTSRTARRDSPRIAGRMHAASR